MPSIEVICVGQRTVCAFEGLPFRVLAETVIVSHRSPRPLFKKEFDALQGCIYHLCQAEGTKFAGDLISGPGPDSLKRDWWNEVYFSDYAPYVHEVLEALLEASPSGTLVFTTDYQFGPKPLRFNRPLTLKRFWDLHNARKIHMNALYYIQTDSR